MEELDQPVVELPLVVETPLQQQVWNTKTQTSAILSAEQIEAIWWENLVCETMTADKITVIGGLSPEEIKLIWARNLVEMDIETLNRIIPKNWKGLNFSLVRSILGDKSTEALRAVIRSENFIYKCY